MTNRAQGRVRPDVDGASSTVPSRLRRAVAMTFFAGLLTTATTGCSWFGGGDDHDDGPAPISPQPAGDHTLAPPTGSDDGRAGLVDRNRNPSVSPSPDRVPMSQRQPMVLAPTTAPVATQPTAALPEYLVLGSVVANVNGSPIYAHELVRQVSPVLRANARTMDERAFRQAALTELKRQRQQMIMDELEYASAQRNTTAEDQREAQARTFAFRERMISQAGGSIEQARAQFAAQGEDFDKAVAREERRNLVMIYLVKKVRPRVIPSVSEMRQYYEQNRDARFTMPSQATIRLIRIDPREVGSDAAAQQRIEEARRRAAAGENFDALSDEYNKMAFLRTNKGRFGPISPGAYAVKEVDQAIWQTEQGQVTPVIHASDGAYYIALVEQRTQGRVKSFDEQEVQDQIRQTIQEQRMGDILQKRREDLLRNATVNADDAMLQPVLEMAMQLYPTWHAAAGS